jgi:hypothetical protein
MPAVMIGKMDGQASHSRVEIKHSNDCGRGLLAETGSGFSRESQVRCRVRPDVRLNSEGIS